MDNSEMAAVATKYIAEINSHDVDAMCALFADDAYQEDPVGNEPNIGINAIREFYEHVLSSDIRAESTGNVRCAGDSVAFPFNAFIGMAGARFKLEVILVFGFNDAGKIKTMKAYWGPENLSEV